MDGASAVSDQARAEADQLMSDKDGPYWDSGHLRHKETVERVTRLLGQAHGSEPVSLEDPNMSSELAQTMTEAMQAPKDPNDYDFTNAGAGQEGWDVEQEGAFREIFHRAQLSQP